MKKLIILCSILVFSINLSLAQTKEEKKKIKEEAEKKEFETTKSLIKSGEYKFIADWATTQSGKHRKDYFVFLAFQVSKGEFQVTALGYELKFLGFRDMPDGKDRVQLEIKVDEKTFPAEAQFYYSNFTNSHMVSPYIKLELLKDIYISPTSYTPAEQGNLVEIILKKGETKRVRQMNITFHNFEMGGEHVDTNVSMVVKADLTITGTGEDKQSYKLKPEYIVKGGEFITPELQIPNKNV